MGFKKYSVYILCTYFRQHGGIVQLLNTSSPRIVLSNNSKTIKVIIGVIHCVFCNTACIHDICV